MTATEAAVRKSVTVKASVERAFQVFTEGWDTWWPRTHHIGKSPMKKAIIEGFPGGRCYAEQMDGTDCPWGEIVAWEPPRRLVIAWKISPQWQYQPDPAKASEVEVTFTRSRMVRHAWTWSIATSSVWARAGKICVNRLIPTRWVGRTCCRCTPLK
jgi:uncharacterized protein YndB with AHSA1/START domain